MEFERRDFHLIGISHHTAGLSVRELWALNREEKKKVLEKLSSGEKGQVVLLGTCNRTEFYFFTGKAPEFSWIEEKVGEVKGKRLETDPSHFYVKKGIEVVEHLFSVASGLDSQILGETEIQGQVREDFAFARSLKACGDELGRLFENALKVGKRARTETKLSEGVISAGQAGVLLAKKVLGDLSRAHVLLVGSGKIGRLTAKALLKEGIASLRVTSRTRENAEALAKEFQVRSVPFENLLKEVATSDVVISSTAAPETLVSASQLSPLIRDRPDRSLVIIDLAVPRDFDPKVGNLPSVFVHDLEDLEQVIARSQKQRQNEVPKCKSIIREEATRFFTRHLYRIRVEPAIGLIFSTAESLRQSELQKETGKLPEEAREVVDRVTRRVVNRILGKAVNRLKSLRNQGLLTAEDMEFLLGFLRVKEDGSSSGRNQE